MKEVHRHMKAFQRALALLLALITVLTLTACGQKPAAQPEQVQEPAAEQSKPAPAEEPAAEESSDAEQTPAPAADVRVGEEFKFTELAADKNGDNGLTFYYTTDGKTLEAFTDRDEDENKWYKGAAGLLVYPALVPADNYGALGTAKNTSVVMGYQLPADGTVNLFTWLALQGASGEHGYRVKIALDSLENVQEQYDCIGDTQTVEYRNYTLKVTAGQTLYLIYEPEVNKDSEWCGYITTVKYLALGDDAVIDSNAPAEVLEAQPMDVDVFEGDAFYYTELATDKNGENGLTLYHTSDGVTLTPFDQRAAEEDKWWHGGQGCLVYPRINLADNYAVAGSSATDYVVVGWLLPADGTIDLFTWTALQGPSGDHGYHVKVALNAPDNIIAEYDCIGDTQTVVAQDYFFDVERGDELFLIYEPAVAKDNEWYGYNTKVTYTAVTK